MTSLTDSENQLLERITDDQLRISLLMLRQAMEKIWAVDTPRIIRDYTDHGIEHCKRLAYYANELLKANEDEDLSAQEMYLLLAGVYLHDIGMQCDVVKFPEIKDEAEILGAQFETPFTTQRSSEYTLAEQKMIRSNHHYLTAAWIEYAHRTRKTALGLAASTIPFNLVEDLMDVCKYHTKLPITGCPPKLKISQTGRKQLVAALLRFSDELDVDSNRVTIEAVQDFSLDPQNSLYWWLHWHTTISFTTRNVIALRIALRPDDVRQYRRFIYEKFILVFQNKNKPVLDTLWQHKIPINISAESNVIENKFAQELPADILEVLRTMQRQEDKPPAGRVQTTDQEAQVADLQKSVVLITSTNPDNYRFGTGFIIHQDELATYVLTCAHVVQEVDGSNEVIAGGLPATEVASWIEEGLDLAVLRVEGLLDKPPLSLHTVGGQGKPFITVGFQLYDKQFLIRELQGKLGRQVGLETRQSVGRIMAWDLKIDDDYLLQPGYSGSPVIDEKSKIVLGVVSHRQSKGQKGLAISVEAFQKLWSRPSPPVEQVREAIGLLGELAQSPDIQGAVRNFRSDFETACQQIKVVGDYKKLHDLFQKLHDQVRIVDQHLKRLPDDLTAWDSLMSNEPELEITINDLLKEAGQASFVTDEALWMERLVQIRQELHVAVRKLDLEPFKNAVYGINRLLNRQPSRINTLLYAKVKDLPLSNLVEAMTILYSNLDQSSLDPEAIRKFKESIATLAKLGESLRALAERHNYWQELADELRRIEANLSQDLDELERAWPDLKRIGQKLYSKNGDDWAQPLITVSIELEQALSTKDPKVRLHFYNYFSRANRRFTQIDQELWARCGNLQEVGTSLAQVLEKIQ